MSNALHYSVIGVCENVLEQDEIDYVKKLLKEQQVFKPFEDSIMVSTWQVEVLLTDPIMLNITGKIKRATEKVMGVKLSNKGEDFRGDIIEYRKGSCAKGHYDNMPGRMGKQVKEQITVVTMIDLSDDLVGGDAWFAKNRNTSATHKMIPGPFGIGDMLMYGYDTFHGVSELIAGRRVVLISWFSKIN